MFLSRIAKTKVPSSTSILEQQAPAFCEISYEINKKLALQKVRYDKQSKDLEKFNIGDSVVIQNKNKWERGRVVRILDATPYVVEDSLERELCRNRIFLRKFTPAQSQTVENSVISQFYCATVLRCLFLQHVLFVLCGPKSKNRADITLVMKIEDGLKFSLH
ncbi:hypothetical protein ABEB36_013023 [Hypothenemus hampei]|uniref:Uncharacterized protein n=1 Tax=Hypothenemus hampei TaxID=57062 RepID=A0ABD1E8M8_HYPHA